MFELPFLEIDWEAIEEASRRHEAAWESLNSMSEERKALAKMYADEIADMTARHFQNGASSNWKKQAAEFRELISRMKKDGVHEEARCLYDAMLVG